MSHEVSPGRRSLRPRIVLCCVSIAATLPYLVLKVIWIAGWRVGIVDPDFGHSIGTQVLNAATFGMELVAVALAIAFVAPWGRRLPASLVLTPMWVATGLLAPIPIAVAWQSMFGAPSRSGDHPASLAGWVFAMVYACFSVLAVTLVAGFVIYARDRWPALLRRPRVVGVLGYWVVSAAVTMWAAYLLILAAVPSDLAQGPHSVTWYAVRVGAVVAGLCVAIVGLRRARTTRCAPTHERDTWVPQWERRERAAGRVGR